MPTYEYACRECGEHIEVVQSFKDGPLSTCGLCGGALRKVFSAAGIIFKGSGYYITDTRKETSTPASSPAASESSSPKDAGSAKAKKDAAKRDSGSKDTAAKSA